MKSFSRSIPLPTATMPARDYWKRVSMRGRVGVAEEMGSVLGYVLLDYTFYDNGFVPLLFVGDQFRRQGVGEQLLLHAVSKCRTQKLFTSTNESNAPMRGLLKKMGFESSGVIHNLDEGDPELVFVRWVSE